MSWSGVGSIRPHSVILSGVTKHQEQSGASQPRLTAFTPVKHNTSDRVAASSISHCDHTHIVNSNNIADAIYMCVINTRSAKPSAPLQSQTGHPLPTRAGGFNVAQLVDGRTRQLDVATDPRTNQL